MAEYENIVFEVKEGVARIRMNRPEDFNALNLAMMRELGQAATVCTNDRGIRAVVITGTDPAFCAGGDVKEMHQHLEETGRGDLYLRELALHLHSFIAELVRMPKPVMAAVNGMAAGAGFSLSLACDLTVAVEGAKFVMAYTNIGLVPDGSSTYYLSRLVGPKKAMEIVYLNEPISAEEGLRLGIVNRVFDREQFEKGVSDMAMRLARGPMDAYGRSKGLIRQGLMETLESQMENERQGIAQSALCGEFKEGVTAFVEKRKPDFV